MTPTPVGMRCPECARERTPVRTMRNIGADPIVTYALIVINVLAFIGEFASGGGGLASQGGGSVINDGGLRSFFIDQGEYYRLITSGFLHAGLIHIGFNMFLLYVLGQMLEPAVGHVRFATIYLTALLGGDFGALLVSPDSLTIGASGAVFGLMGAAVLTLRSRGFDPRASGIPALIVFNLVLSVVIPGISIGGHIGGLLAGAAAAYALVEVGERPRLAIAGYAGCILIAAAAVAGSIAITSGASNPVTG